MIKKMSSPHMQSLDRKEQNYVKLGEIFLYVSIKSFIHDIVRTYTSFDAEHKIIAPIYTSI